MNPQREFIDHLPHLMVFRNLDSRENGEEKTNGRLAKRNDKGGPGRAGLSSEGKEYFSYIGVRF